MHVLIAEQFSFDFRKVSCAWRAEGAITFTFDNGAVIKFDDSEENDRNVYEPFQRYLASLDKDLDWGME